MVAVLALFAPLMMLRADDHVHTGRDEFGRRCQLRLEPDLAVMIEDEWYASARDEEFRASVGGRGRTGRLYATLSAASDQTPGELDVSLTNGRGTWFTLTLTSASYYVHTCRIEN